MGKNTYILFLFFRSAWAFYSWAFVRKREITSIFRPVRAFKELPFVREREKETILNFFKFEAFIKVLEQIMQFKYANYAIQLYKLCNSIMQIMQFNYANYEIQ